MEQFNQMYDGINLGSGVSATYSSSNSGGINSYSIIGQTSSTNPNGYDEATVTSLRKFLDAEQRERKIAEAKLEMVKESMLEYKQEIASLKVQVDDLEMDKESLQRDIGKYRFSHETYTY